MLRKNSDRHNKELLTTLSKGDMVEFTRGSFSHWGIYAGNEEIIHLITEEKGKSLLRGISTQLRHSKGILAVSAASCAKSGTMKGFVLNEKFLDVAGHSKAIINNQLDGKYSPRDPDKIVERARTKLGRKDYDLFNDNCEHFATWCRYEKAISLQATKGAKDLDMVDTVATIITGAVTVVAAAAAAAAAGVMVGLALLKLS